MWKKGQQLLGNQHRSPRKGGSVFPHSTRGRGGGEVGAGKGRGEKKVREGRVLYKAFSE